MAQKHLKHLSRISVRLYARQYFFGNFFLKLQQSDINDKLSRPYQVPFI